MEKKGGALLIIGIIVGILIISLVGVSIYFYQFHVFKTLRVCVGEEALNTNVTCSSDKECIGFATQGIEGLNNSDFPSFIQDKLDEIYSKSIYCSSTCYVRNVRGLDQVGELESCNSDENEVKIDLHGKELLEVRDMMKNLEE